MFRQLENMTKYALGNHGSNIHDHKDHMKNLNSQEQLSFLKNMACINPRGEDKESKKRRKIRKN